MGVVCVKTPRKILDVGVRHPELFWQLHYNDTTVFLTLNFILHLLLQIVGYYMKNRVKRHVKSCKCKCIRSLFSQVEHCIFIVKFYWRFKFYHTSLKNTEGKRVRHATKIVRDLCIPTCRPPFWTRGCAHDTADVQLLILPLRQCAFLLIKSWRFFTNHFSCPGRAISSLFMFVCPDINFVTKRLQFRYSACWFNLTLPRRRTKVKLVIGQSSRLQEENKSSAAAEMADRGWKADLNWKL